MVWLIVEAPSAKSGVDTLATQRIDQEAPERDVACANGIGEPIG